MKKPWYTESRTFVPPRKLMPDYRILLSDFTEKEVEDAVIFLVDNWPQKYTLPVRLYHPSIDTVRDLLERNATALL